MEDISILKSSMQVFAFTLKRIELIRRQKFLDFRLYNDPLYLEFMFMFKVIRKLMVINVCLLLTSGPTIAIVFYKSCMEAKHQ